METASDQGHFDPNDAQSWYAYAMSLVEGASTTEQRPFVADVIDNQVRYDLLDGDVFVSIQPGLAYDPDLNTLADDWMVGIDTWSLYIPAEETILGVQLDVDASTIDTAKVTNHPEMGEFDREPAIETTTFVDCELSSSVFLNSNGFDVVSNVTINQRMAGQAPPTPTP